MMMPPPRPGSIDIACNQLQFGAALGLVTVLVEVVAALASENENVVEEPGTEFCCVAKE